ncbi:MAG: hypothetical protein ACLFTH_02370 [Candidatus Woesearchaeota archaeon]
MFVRAKKVKGRYYGYLVDNKWVDGKVRQKVKKYLGPIRELSDTGSDLYFDLDTTTSSRSCLRDCIAQEFISRGFARVKNRLKKEDLTIDLVTGRIRSGNKSVVLFLNGRYLHDTLLRHLLSFNEPESEEDTPGKRLARAFSDAGIGIDKTVFILLYKKLYRS